MSVTISGNTVLFPIRERGRETLVNDSRLVLLTGGTGYVGGRLLRALEAAGYNVRCLSRHPEALSQRVAQTTEILKGDVLDADSLAPSMVGVHAAYYLVHSMASAKLVSGGRSSRGACVRSHSARRERAAHHLPQRTRQWQ